MSAEQTTIEIHDLDEQSIIELIEVADQLSSLDYVRTVSIDAEKKTIVAVADEFDGLQFSTDFNSFAHEQFGYKTITGQTEEVFVKAP